MKKYLSHFWWGLGVKEFDTVTGAVANAPDVRREDTPFGSVWKQNGKWFAFHHDDQSLLLQHRANIWRVTPDYSVSLRAWFILRNFNIRHQGKTVFSIWYKPKYLFLSLLDPTHDGIDAESDDFFLYVKNMWQVWVGKPFEEFMKERDEQ